MDAVGVRLQGLSIGDQTLALARLAVTRGDDNRFATADVQRLFEEVGLPLPGNTSDVLGRLRRNRFVTRARGTGRVWGLTPTGRSRSEGLASDLDLRALAAEGAATGGATFAGSVHPVVPPSLAPPGLVEPLREFLAHHPFDRNVFGMTRFPDDDEDNPDPVAPALQAAHDVCERHGLEFHLASDRAIHDDLWLNVAGHMWASRYGIAFFENRRGRGINYNLTIEVGSMLMTGRRCALLKDDSTNGMPTDLVGHIYRSVNLGAVPAVEQAVHNWIRDDLGLGPCPGCAPPRR